MDNETDPYWKLRPISATPEDEVCRCEFGVAVILRDGLTDNPLFCVECHGEVPPERLGFDARLAEDIASWRSAYDSLFRLWLDSGEYEPWAKARLMDPSGQVNTRGRNLVERLNAFVPAFYWWFKDTDAPESERLCICPVCSGALTPYGKRDLRACEACRILV
jgi:hypothetical protein